MSKLIKIKSAKTCSNILTMLKTIFKYARRWGYIRISPTEGVDKYRVEREEMDFLRPDEINLLLKQCREPFKTFVLTAVLTGMRKAGILTHLHLTSHRPRGKHQVHSVPVGSRLDSNHHGSLRPYHAQHKSRSWGATR